MSLSKKISPLRPLIVLAAVVALGAGAMAISAKLTLPRSDPSVEAGNAAALPASENASKASRTAVSSVSSSYTETGRILVITRESPSTYLKNSHGPTGFEYDLATAFAKFLGVKAEFKVLDTEEDVIRAMEAGVGHIAAAGLARTPERERRVRFGPDYFTTEPQVVCRAAGPSCRSVIGLVKHKVAVVEGSYHEYLLEEFRAHYPKLTWFTVPGSKAVDLLRMVSEQKADFAVLDSNLVSIERRTYPSVVAAFSLAPEYPLAWAVSKGQDDLLARVYLFMEENKTRKLILSLKEKYYGHPKSLGHKDSSAFHQRVRTRLPQLELKFQKAARDHGIAWEVLAAVAYQESLWDEDARSALGVKGLMMITDRTAASLGITDPYDADQSIRGGARYLAKLLREVPKGVKGNENRLRYALVAYNIGPGHLEDARKLARRMGKNPNSWHDMKDVLPLLSLKAYHRKLPLGYARGAESVRYVGKVFSYKEILERKGAPRLPKLRLNQAKAAKKSRRRHLATQQEAAVELLPAS